MLITSPQNKRCEEKTVNNNRKMLQNNTFSNKSGFTYLYQIYSNSVNKTNIKFVFSPA